MIDRILVTFDTPEQSRGTLPHARTIARTFASRLSLVHVFEENAGRTCVDPLDWYMQRGKLLARLNMVGEQLRNQDLEVEPVLLDGRKAERILSFADESLTSLILLQSGDEAVGPVVHKVISCARHSLMIVRGQDGERALADEALYQRILVPLDGSKRAECVLPAAAALAAYCGATLILAHVVGHPQVVSETPDLCAAAERLVQRNRDEAACYLEQVQSQLNFACKTRLVVAGDPIAALHDLCEAERADLVLLSAHGYSCRMQQPYGRVAASFLYEGTVPLLLIQDVPPQEIGLSPAQQAAGTQSNQTAKRQNTVPTISFQ